MLSPKYLFAKAMKYIRVPAVRDSTISPKSRICPGSNLISAELGDYSYVGNDCSIAHTTIGKFCSIGSNCSIGGGVHPMEHVSTSPVFHKGRNILGVNFAQIDEPTPKRVLIGNDVWVGDTVFIRDGVSVGDGAVVGAHSVVTKDIPPYAVVAGCPARLLRYRFDDMLVKELLDSRWWDCDEECLRECASLSNEPWEFISKLRSVNKR